MEWMPVEAAASSLGCSVRTVYRRIKAGEVQTRRIGDRVEVAVEASDTDGQNDRRLTDIAAASLTMRRMDADTVSAIRQDFRDNLRVARWTALGTSVLVLASVGLLAWGGYRWHLADLEHVQTVAGLEADNHALKAELCRASDLGVQMGIQVRTSQQAQAQASSEASRATVERDRARIERDRALAVLRATRIVEAALAWLSTPTPQDAPQTPQVTPADRYAGRGVLSP